MEPSIVTLLLIAATVFILYKGFINQRFINRYCFDVDKVLVQKDCIRFISSGVFHTGWWHLIFNMIALYAFGTLLEPFIGSGKLLGLYFISLTRSGLLVLFIHRAQAGHTSVGASGAINGIVFAAIALFPGMGMGLFILPISISAWAFGLAYALFTIYGIKAAWGNTGHAAHLGGALIGMLSAIAFIHGLSPKNLPILLLIVPSIAFILFLIYKPHLLLLGSFKEKKSHYSIDHKYKRRRAQRQADIDGILEKFTEAASSV